MTYLNYDSSGFIVGMNRMKDGIDKVHDDAQEIVQILKSQNQIANTRMSELARAIKDNTSRARITGITRTNRNRNQSAGLPASNDGIPSSSNTSSNRTQPSTRASQNTRIHSGNSDISSRDSNANRSNRTRIQAGDSDSNSASVNNPDTNNSRSTRASNRLNPDIDPAPTNTRSTSTARRERDANGRFIPSDSDSDTDSDNGDKKSPSSLSKLASAISSAMRGSSGGSGNVDPVLESFKEAKELLSPLGRGAKLLGRGANMGLSKIRALKRREPLSQDQSNHNRENEKLLDKIWKAILKSRNGGGAGGAGLLGGILGGGKKGVMKKALKMLTGTPGKIIAGIAGSVALASNWDKINTEEKGAGIGDIAGGVSGAMAGGFAGATIGSVIPVVGTAVGAVVGAGIGGWLGSDAGTVLGQQIAPNVKRWTDSMASFNLPVKMLNSFTSGLKPLFSGAGSIWDWVKDKIGGMIGFGGGDNESDSSDGGYTGEDGSYTGDSVVTAKADKAGDYIAKNAAPLNQYGGRCAFAVRSAIQAGGYTGLVQQPEAKGYTASVMNKAGFSTVPNETRAAPKKGDVMVFAAQGKHKSGHIQMYDGADWYSDAKQRSDMPYGDIKAENAQYKYYRDTSGGVKSGGNANAGKSTGSVKSGGSRETEAMDFFISRGYSKVQAAGIVGNLHKETGGFREDVIRGDKSGRGDGGKAVGIAQWHPPRQRDFQKAMGKNLVGASFQDQLKFVDYELRNGGPQERKAGRLLKNATTPAQAAAIVSEFYERPAATEPEKKSRGQIAEGVLRRHSGNTKAAANTPAPVSGSDNILKKLGYTGNNTLQAATQSYGAIPSRLPAVPSVVVPSAPKIVDRIDSGANKPIVLQASNDTINQNVSDRGLAHAITGGLGQDRYWG